MSGAVKLNPLSVAKGKKFVCELCGKAATLACQHCRVTYYCAKEHQSVDWYGIHEKICQLLGALRTLRPTLGSEEERQRRNLTVQMSQHALIDLCKNEAQKQLVAAHYELAIPGALQSLRFSMEVYGAGRIELVPAYLLLAESNLGLKRYKVAEEFLLYANWSVLKNPDCSNELKSQLYRNFGKLYASQGRYEDALKQLAQDVYYSSLESGPEHIDTAGGYFYMADVFLTQTPEQVENALALYDKVVDIWYKFLIKLRRRPDESISDYLSEAHIGEAVEMLKSILSARKRYLGRSHIAVGEASYALATLKHITGFESDARRLYRSALVVYEQHFGGNESTLAIKAALAELPPSTEQELKEEEEERANAKLDEEEEENERKQRAAAAMAAAAAGGDEFGSAAAGGAEEPTTVVGDGDGAATASVDTKTAAGHARAGSAGSGSGRSATGGGGGGPAAASDVRDHKTGFKEQQPASVAAVAAPSVSAAAVGGSGAGVPAGNDSANAGAATVVAAGGDS